MVMPNKVQIISHIFINSALLLITSFRGDLKELEKLHFPISLSQILDVKLKREIELAGGSGIGLKFNLKHLKVLGINQDQFLNRILLCLR